MATIQFTDNSAQVKAALDGAIVAYLYEAAGELEAQTKRNTRVDTGNTKSSWSYHVDEAAGKAVVGSTLENAIWEEFGTGEYALHNEAEKAAGSTRMRKAAGIIPTVKSRTELFKKLLIH